MIKIIDGRNLQQNAHLMEKVWRLRHEVFVEEKGWEAIRRSDGREIDQFDTGEALHILYIQDENILGYSRLLPTLGPHLLSDVYPQLCDGEVPRSKQMWEWTRFCTEKSHRGSVRSLSYVSNCLLSAIVEWGMANDVHEIGIQMNRMWMLTLCQLRFRPIPLGVIQELDGEEVLAVQCKFDERSLISLQKARGDKDLMLPELAEFPALEHAWMS